MNQLEMIVQFVRALRMVQTLDTEGAMKQQQEEALIHSLHIKFRTAVKDMLKEGHTIMNILERLAIHLRREP